MKKFMAWLGFVSVTDIPEVVPVPGRNGVSVWDEMVAEFGDPFSGSWRPAAVMPDWAAA